MFIILIFFFFTPVTVHESSTRKTRVGVVCINLNYTNNDKLIIIKYKKKKYTDFRSLEYITLKTNQNGTWITIKIVVCVPYSINFLALILLFLWQNVNSNNTTLKYFPSDYTRNRN